MTDAQKWLVLAFFLVSGWLIYLLAPILMPFAFAAILAYLGDPLADKLEAIKIKSYRLGRTSAVIMVFTMMLLVVSIVLMILIPKIEFQISQLLTNFPSYVLWLNKTVIPWAEHQMELKIGFFDADKVIAMAKSHWQSAGKSAISLVSSVSQSGAVLAGWVMNIVLIPVITFYLLRDWDILVAMIRDLLPRRIAPTAIKLALETNEVLGAFMRGQFYVMLGLGMIYSVGLWFAGLELALLIGMMAGIVSFVPYLGAIVGVVVACIAALFQFQDVMSLIPVAIVFMVGQSMEGMVLTPLLVGDKIGLHPVAVMFAVLAGGQLFGFLGVLLALPVASVVMVFLRHIHEVYTGSDFYSEEKVNE
ncbi:MAG: AI-2E family transporter [Gammaproteobacteria bacterium]|nr:MAG: AI-2E family transporter [Gammaproteobacteria bacterium]